MKAEVPTATSDCETCIMHTEFYKVPIVPCFLTPESTLSQSKNYSHIYLIVPFHDINNMKTNLSVLLLAAAIGLTTTTTTHARSLRASKPQARVALSVSEKMLPARKSVVVTDTVCSLSLSSSSLLQFRN